MKYAVDRIIEEIVVLENIETGEILEESIKKLPRKIKEGSIVVLKDNDYYLDIAKEEEIRKNLRERLERLKKISIKDGYGKD